MRTALVVSDDVHTQAWIARAIAQLEVRADTVAARDMLFRLQGGDYNVVIADLVGAGERIVQDIERSLADSGGCALLVLVEPEMLGALRMPAALASDFVVKGASSEEFAARLRVLLWPGEAARSEEVVRIDELTLNLASYQATVHGEAVDFTYLEYALFAFLVTHPGRTYSREALLQRVWGTDYFGGSRTVDVHIRRVRAKIGPELAARLETVRNVGYLWNG